MFGTSKAILLCLIFSSLVWSAPAADTYPEFGLFSRIHKLSGVQQKPNTLAKKAALQWRQTGAIHYTTANTIDSSWNISLRDTIIYDVDGNEVVKMASRSNSGWSKNDLESFDSTVYQSGNIVEYFLFVYSSGGFVYGANKSSFTYLNGGQTLVETVYDWVDSLPNWIPADKDSLIFSTPLDIKAFFNMTFVPNFLKKYNYTYKNSSWNMTGYRSKIDSECNATTLVIGGKYQDYYNIDWKDDKVIMVYNSSLWSNDNLVEYIIQERSPDGQFYDNYKRLNSEKGYTDNYYEWDSGSKSPVCTEKVIGLVDSHKKDSVYFCVDFNKSVNSWDTTSGTSYTRTYDENGNNITTVESDYSYQTKTWQFVRKDVKIFAQINVPVIHSVKAFPRRNISILQTAGFIRFSAPDITGLELYNIEGRLVASVKQNAASFVTLNLTGPNSKISSGSYIAKLECKEPVNSIPVVIKK